MLKLDSLDFYPVSDYINTTSIKQSNFLRRFCLILNQDLLKMKNWNINRNTQGLAVLKASEDDPVKYVIDVLVYDKIRLIFIPLLNKPSFQVLFCKQNRNCQSSIDCVLYRWSPQFGQDTNCQW